MVLPSGSGSEQVAASGRSQGHHLRLDADGRLIGVTIVNAKHLLERDGKIVLTLLDRVEVGPEALNAALAAPSS